MNIDPNNPAIFGRPRADLLADLQRFLITGETRVFMSGESTQSGSPGIGFLKPEICDAGKYLCLSALEELDARGKTLGYKVSGVYGISGQMLVKRNLLMDIYPIIFRNAFVSVPASALREPFLSASRSCFAEPVPVVGGCVLEKEGFRPSEIFRKWMSAPQTLKASEDCYAAPVFLNGRPRLLINGFAPLLVQQYSAPTARVLVAEIISLTKFELLKTRLQGNADPSRRSSDSYRTFLNDEIVGMGRSSLSTSLNGFHLSGSKEQGIRKLQP